MFILKPSQTYSFINNQQMVTMHYFSSAITTTWLVWLCINSQHIYASLMFVAVRFRYIYSPGTSLCFVFWPDGATDNSLHHRWTVFPVSSSIHVECSDSFCPFFHISVTVQKSTQDRTIRAFIPEILLKLSLRLWLNIFVPWCEVFEFTSH